eukprot:2201074-Karenia_brevis.AAC.1
MTRAHAWLHPAHYHAPSSVCMCCLLDFHTRNRLLQHLMYKSSVCLHNLLLRGPLLTELEVRTLNAAHLQDEADLRRAGFRRSKAKAPVVRLEGPLLPVLCPDMLGT